MDYKWPDAADRHVIGTRKVRVDGPDKSAGRAKYTYDATPKGLLAGAVLRSPHAHARLVSVDTSAAEKMPGVKAVVILQKPGTSTIRWAGDEVVAVAAVDEPTAYDAIGNIKVRWEVLPHFVDDFTEPPADIPEDTGPLSMEDLIGMFSNQVPEGQIAAAINKRGIDFEATPQILERAKRNGSANVAAALEKAQVKPASSGPKVPYHPSQASTTGDPDGAFKTAAAVSEGIYGVPVIAHCCLESHGAVAMWTDPDHLDVQISTQAVSSMPGQVSDGLKNPLFGIDIPPTNIHMHQQHVGGGFGSKFTADRWSSAAAALSKKAGGAPVKIMLDRRAELEVAGARPSGYARVKVAADKDGKIIAWDSRSWSTGGPGGGGPLPIPYVFRDIPNVRTQHTAVDTNEGPSRAWRAPNHPQAAVLTMCALEDLAAKLNMDPYDLIMKNADMAQRAREYKEELAKADELMGWKKRWHPRGDKAAGPIKRGLGLSIHTWGGRGHESHCDLSIHSDGSVEMKMGTQDLGTGTRTAIMMVIAESGIPMEAITLKIGDTNYPMSGGSGGSTTIGGVSSAARRASVDAINALFEKVAPALGTTADKLEVANGQVRIRGGGNGLPWKQACAKLGPTGITTQGVNYQQASRNKPDLTNAGVGGVQMADVSVDVETGIVRVNKMVAVQDCGLVVNLKTAESQVYGALIMGISYALFEEKVMDPGTGRMLNSNLEFYRLAGYGDIPELVVHMMTGPGYDERGVIGLGEPPVISPGACIANAVANAIGVRVPFLPLTPNRVLEALNKNGGVA